MNFDYLYIIQNWSSYEWRLCGGIGQRIMGKFTFSFPEISPLRGGGGPEKDQVLGEEVGVSVTSVWPYEFVCLPLFSGLF